MKVSELSGAELDYWVARATGMLLSMSGKREFRLGGFSPSTEWKDGGPLIEREGITLQKMDYIELGRTDWQASKDHFRFTCVPGPTPLIAAMRAFVASRFGEEVGDGI